MVDGNARHGFRKRGDAVEVRSDQALVLHIEHKRVLRPFNQPLHRAQWPKFLDSARIPRRILSMRDRAILDAEPPGYQIQRRSESAENVTQ
jgi:hypothetical protein